MAIENDRIICEFLVAITAFYSLTEGFLVFAHPTPVRFLKGLGNFFFQVRKTTPVWYLDLILRRPMKPILSQWLPVPLLTYL